MLTHVGTNIVEAERLILRRFEYTDDEAMLKYWVADEKIQSLYSEPVYSTKDEVKGSLDFFNSFKIHKPLLWAWHKLRNMYHIPVIKITTEMLRKYLVEYQAINNCGKVTIDNIRRSLSTFFSWLEEEDYIIKSPMKRIHKVKTAVIVKDTISDRKFIS